MTWHAPGSRRILDDGLDLPTVEGESNMVGTVFLHGNGTLKWSVTNSQRDAILSSLLDSLGGLVIAVACYNLTIDLEKNVRTVEVNIQSTDYTRPSNAELTLYGDRTRHGK